MFIKRLHMLKLVQCFGLQFESRCARRLATPRSSRPAACELVARLPWTGPRKEFAYSGATDLSLRGLHGSKAPFIIFCFITPPCLPCHIKRSGRSFKPVAGPQATPLSLSGLGPRDPANHFLATRSAGPGTCHEHLRGCLCPRCFRSRL